MARIDGLAHSRPGPTGSGLIGDIGRSHSSLAVHRLTWQKDLDRSNRLALAEAADACSWKRMHYLLRGEEGANLFRSICRLSIAYRSLHSRWADT
jgi:hypothetical protein